MIKTKFGTAKINSLGYYQIKSKEEGNFNKYLHRLIFEDFYQISLPKHTVIHHEDGNKTNNEIWNLIPMTKSEHSMLHGNKENHPWIGKHHSKESRLKISGANNSTGLFRVHKHLDKGCSQGFYWDYNYRDENHKKCEIRSSSLEVLEQKVKSKGLEWEILDSELAEQSIKESEEYVSKKLKEHTTGVLNVMKHVRGDLKQGFSWKFEIVIDKKRIAFTSVNPQKLKDKVLNAGFDWVIVNEKKAMENGLL